MVTSSPPPGVHRDPFATGLLRGIAALAILVLFAPAWPSDAGRDGRRDGRHPRGDARIERASAERDRVPANRVAAPESEPVVPRKPPTEECDLLTDPGERLACKEEKTNAEVGRTVESLTGPDGDLLTDRQKTFVRNAHDRAEQERERTGVEGYRQLTRKREVDCFVKEFDDPTGTDPDDDGNNDGICDRGELCAEDDLDQIGDNDGKCETFKQGKGKPIREVCVEICDPDAIDADEGNFDEAAGLDAEGPLDDGAVLLSRLNEELATTRVGTGGLDAIEIATDGDACSDLLVGERQFPYLVLQIAQGSANVLKAVHDGCTDVTRQSTGGFNSSAACVKSAIAMNLVQLTQDAFELQDDSVTGERVDATTSCLELLGAEVQANGDEVDAIAARLEEAEDEIGARLDELIRLLQTPPGRRPDFPLDPAGKP